MNFFLFSGNLTAGNYTEKPGLKGLKQCVMECCLSESCNIVFIYDLRCFHVECVSNELCLPLQRTGSRKWEASHVSMILVKPVLPNGNAWTYRICGIIFKLNCLLHFLICDKKITRTLVLVPSPWYFLNTCFICNYITIPFIIIIFL